jgi:dTDP-4-dehydrorhamnose 3,5-epimerase-like enzyme
MKLKVKHIKPEFKDERGFISRIIDESKYSIKSILYIERKKGTRGADHYHKKDSHYVYILSGKVKRSEKNMADEKSKIESVVLGPGDLVLTPPMVAHSDVFLEDTVMLAFTTENRNPKQYEKDTVRVDFFKEA